MTGRQAARPMARFSAAVGVPSAKRTLTIAATATAQPPMRMARRRFSDTKTSREIRIDRAPSALVERMAPAKVGPVGGALERARLERWQAQFWTDELSISESMRARGTPSITVSRHEALVWEYVLF